MIKKSGTYTTDFSEFTYGYAITRNIEAWQPRIIAVPSFPSLIDEGKPGGGYDVRIERPVAPLFLQFKIPRVIRRPKTTTSESGLITPPYYRMYLHPRNSSDQQKLLLDLAAKYPAVFYVTPEFDDAARMDAHHRGGQVINNSAFFRPTDIGLLPDDEEHYIAYKAGGSMGYFCSEPHEIAEVGAGGLFDLVARLMDRHPSERDDFFTRLIIDMMAIIEGNDPQLAFRDEESGWRAYFGDALEIYAAYIAQMFFDCQLFILFAPTSWAG